ncbi:MAG: hypothetical protein PHT69_01500 [Bacteroidales bacterium]|nr:hypothetical protein [Bacteroidales bacterium]
MKKIYIKMKISACPFTSEISGNCIRNTKKVFMQFLMVVTLALFFAGSAMAQTVYDWTGNTSTAWATPTNWSPNGNPGANPGDIVRIGVVAFTSGRQPAYSVVAANALASITIGTATNATLTNTADMTCGSLTIGSGSTLTISGNRKLTVNGATSLSGTLNLGGNKDKKFTGNVIINSGGVWNESTASKIFFSGNLENNGTFTANTGLHTFQGVSKTISGTSAISIPTSTFTKAYTNSADFTVSTLLTVTGTTLTNNGTITATTSLAGTGGLTQGVNSTLNIGNGITITTLTATATGNTVNYNRTNTQTGKVTTYYNLTLSGSNAKTFATTPTVNGTLSMEGTATVVVTTGVVTYGPNATLQYNTATNRTVSAEEWISPFTATGGIVITNTATITVGAAKVIDNGSKLTLNNGTLAAGTNLTMNSNSAIYRCDGVITGTLQGTGTYDLYYTCSSKTTGPEFINGGLRHVDISLSSGQTLTAGAGTTVNGNFTIASGSTFAASTFTQNIKGNFTNNGTFTASTSTINLNGSGTAQTIGGSTVTSFNNLTINNSSGVNLARSSNVTGLLTLTSGNFTVGAYTLTISGSSPTGTSSVDASNTSATVVFTNASAITLPSSFFTGTVKNLTINGAGGVTAAQNFTVNGVLSLQSANPSATKGSLDMGSNTLTMASTATTTGIGDVEGYVKRTSFSTGTNYTFGNTYTRINFASGGATDVTFKITIGVAPAWKPGAVLRTYDIFQTGGSGTLTLTLHYLDGELNGNAANRLVFWDNPPTTELGQSTRNSTNKWISLSNISTSYFATTEDSQTWALANKSIIDWVWTAGAGTTNWDTGTNWDQGTVPTDTSNVVIPDAGTTAHDPTLSATATCKTINIEPNGILNGSSNTFTVTGASGAWTNSGTFNPGSGTVLFNNAEATMSGTTNFNNVTVDNGAALSLQEDNIMRIGGSLTLTGTGVLNANSFANTVEYNGAGQTVINPNGSPAGYYNLILSGSGTKTMPGTALTIAGDFSLTGTASATAGAAMTVAGNVNIGAGTTFNGSSFTHNVGGNWINNGGTFTGASSTINFNNTTVNQSIQGTATTQTFNNLTVAKSETNLVIEGSTTTVAVESVLTMTSGNIDCNSQLLELGTSAPSEGTLNYTAGSIIGCFKRWLTTTSGAKRYPIGTAVALGNSTANRDALLTFTDLTSGSLTGCFTASNPGSNGLPLSDGVYNIGVNFTEGYWVFSAANSLASTNYDMELTGTGFSSQLLDAGVRLLKRANAASAWANTGWGTHVAASGATVKRSGLSGFSEFGFGKDLCNGIDVTGSTTDPTCFLYDGAINITANGGNPPFTYDWADLGGTSNPEDRTGLAAGSYSVTITDNDGCTVSSGAIVLNAPSGCEGTSVCQSDATSVFSTNPDPSNTGYIWTVSPSGPVIVSGQDSASVVIDWTGAALGTYSVCVEARNLCDTTPPVCKDVYVHTPTVAASYDPVCSGGDLQLHASGGVSYAWSGPGFTSQTQNPVILNVSAGTPTYTVTVTDNEGCSGTANVNVTVSTAPSVSGTTSAASCGNNTGSINITVTDGVSPTYLWSNSETTEDITDLFSDNYTVTVTNNPSGCYAIANFAVSNSDGPIATISAQTNVSCKNGNNGSLTVTPSGGTAPYDILWSNSSSSATISSLSAGTYSVTITDDAGCEAFATATITEPDALLVNSTQTNINCNGGSTGAINLTVTGGAGSFTYQWSDLPGSPDPEDRSGLTEGTYTVTITDANSCTLTESYTLTQPAAALDATPAITNVKCYGGQNGQVVLTVSGGTSPYTYSWSGPVFSATTKDITGLYAGTYSVTVTDNKGCTKVLSSVIVGQPSAAILLTATQVNINCNGGSNGSINLTVSGGTPSLLTGYTFLWSNGATTEDISGLVSGSYSVTVTDSLGCSDVLSKTITQPAQLTATATPVSPLCNGYSTGSIDLSVSGGTIDYDFLWSNNETTEDLANIPAGNYSVTVTDDNGCTAIAATAVTQPAAVTIDATLTNVLCNASTTGAIDITVTGGTVTLDYDYDWGGGITTADRSGLVAGNYTVTVSDDNGCSATASFSITQPSAMSLTMIETNVSCFGGSNGMVNLTVNGGVTPYTFIWSNDSITEDIYGLSIGNYSVTVTDANSCVKTLTSAALTQPDVLTVSASSDNVTCKDGTDGSISLTPAGGTPAYSYSWSNGLNTQNISNLTAGIYSVTVTDSKGCTATTGDTITEPATAIELFATIIESSSCGIATGSIDLTVNNGTAPFSYSWSGPTAIGNIQDPVNISEGVYTVTVTDDNSCTGTLSITVTKASNLDITVFTYPKECIYTNGAATASVGGGVYPYSYNWSNGGVSQTISLLDLGTYYVTVTDANGCTASNSGVVGSISCLPPVAVNDTFYTPYNTTLNGTIKQEITTPMAMWMIVSSLYGRNLMPLKVL